MTYNIAVLTGGRSNERDRSFLSGVTVEAALRDLGHRATIIDINSARFLSGLDAFDVGFVAAAGEYGEDGRLQGCLDTIGLPYTGSGVGASAIGMNKPLFKRLAHACAVPVLSDVSIEAHTGSGLAADKILSAIDLPILLKPTSDGCSNHIYVSRSSAELVSVLDRIRTLAGTTFMAEPFIEGATSLTVGVLERGSQVCALPVLEVEAPGDFYDAASKRTVGAATYHCPARISEAIASEAQRLAVLCHKAIDCHSHSRVDFVLQGSTLYVLEINTAPGLSRAGNLATMAQVAGLTYTDLIQGIVDNAFQPRSKYTTAIAGNYPLAGRHV